MDSVHDHRKAAVEEAEGLLKRARGLAAVRVVAVEPRNGEFREAIVFYGSSTLAPIASPPRPSAGLGPAQPAGMPLAAAQPWPTTRIVLLVALILVTAAIGVLNHRNATAQPWVFDSPDAQRPHAVSMPWQGAPLGQH